MWRVLWRGRASGLVDAHSILKRKSAPGVKDSFRLTILPPTHRDKAAMNGAQPRRMDGALGGNLRREGTEEEPTVIWDFGVRRAMLRGWCDSQYWRRGRREIRP